MLEGFEDVSSPRKTDKPLVDWSWLKLDKIRAKLRTRSGSLKTPTPTPTEVDTPLPTPEVDTSPPAPEADTPTPTPEADTLTDAPKSPKDYFQDWEETKLDGNPHLMATIKDNIIRAEIENHDQYLARARELGISVEELKIRLQQKVEDLVNRSSFFRATERSVLDKVLNTDGRYKSQFETGNSGGCLDKGLRGAYETEAFGFNKRATFDAKKDPRGFDVPKDVIEDNKEDRPIYGYFSEDEHGAINSKGTVPPRNNVIQYGNITVKIKKESALRKATVTFQDSLGHRDCPPTPAVKPHFTSLKLSRWGDFDLHAIEKASVPSWSVSSYTEAQFHGQLTVDDIEAIYVSEDNETSPQEMREIREIYNKFKKNNPSTTIKFIEY